MSLAKGPLLTVSKYDPGLFKIWFGTAAVSTFRLLRTFPSTVVPSMTVGAIPKFIPMAVRIPDP
jgi:hypothetical protein